MIEHHSSYPFSTEEIEGGTYSFCANCKKENNCCVKVRPNDSVDAPILFSEDIKRIETFIKMNASAFSIQRHEDVNDKTRIMKFSERGCFFCNKGICDIYLVRPVDCRLFPVDVKEKDLGSLVWIAYTSICPVKFDLNECLKNAVKLLPQLGKNIVEYARIQSPSLEREKYIELGSL